MYFKQTIGTTLLRLFLLVIYVLHLVVLDVGGYGIVL